VISCFADNFFVLAQRQAQFGARELGKKEHLMSDAQLGLVVAAPIIIGFSLALYRMGVLQGYSTAIAVGASCVIAAVLFLQQ
jgi:hypothetical protein